MNKQIFDDIKVVYNGELISITSLPKEQYEYFLDLIHNLRIAYITLNKI